MERNYRVVGLAKHDDHFSVLILKEGESEPHDTGNLVGEFVDVFELGDDGIFGYYNEDERKILLRGVTKQGEDKNPRTGNRRRVRLTAQLVNESSNVDDPTSEQRCRMCQVVKPMAEFSRYAKSKTGYRNYCKECAREAAAKYLATKRA